MFCPLKTWLDKDPKNNSVLNLIWAGHWSRDVLRLLPTWMLLWVSDCLHMQICSGSTIVPMGLGRLDWLQINLLSMWCHNCQHNVRHSQKGDCSVKENWVFNIPCVYTRHLTYRSHRINNLPLRNVHLISSVILERDSALHLLSPSAAWVLRGAGLTDHPLPTLACSFFLLMSS